MTDEQMIIFLIGRLTRGSGQTRLQFIERVFSMLDGDDDLLGEAVVNVICQFKDGATCRDIARRCRPFGRLSQEKRIAFASTLVEQNLIQIVGYTQKGTPIYKSC